MPLSRGWSASVFDVEAVTFRNDQGLMLFGTVHRPNSRDRRLPAVILLSPGVKMRVGPGRLYVPLTEMLTALGYTVFRFDFFGLGDSEGELEERMLPDVYNNIEVGRYVEDTLAAINWLSSTHGFGRFVLGGLCGGAITALLAARREPRVEALLSIGMTVTLASQSATPGKYMTQAVLEHRRQRYLKRLLSLKSWLRLLTFKSDYNVIWHSMWQMLFQKTKVDSPAEPGEQRGNANPLFPPAFLEFLGRGGRALMVFSEKDGLRSAYEEKFAEPYAEQLRPLLERVDKHVVSNANHVLSFREWQLEMLSVCRAWVMKLSAG
jgi:pimeloyl-ACP methyl ester carboxylesterase